MGFLPGTGGFRAALPLLEPLPSLFSERGGEGGGGVDDEEVLDVFEDALELADEPVDPLEPLDPFDEPLALDEILAVDDEDDDSLESYFLTGFGGDGSSSQFTQPKKNITIKRGLEF